MAQTIPPAEVQIAATVQAAPEEMRSGAALPGYGINGKLAKLRKSTNEVICLADDPKDVARFSAACYHKDLEPFKAHECELRAQGTTGGKRNAEDHWKEIKEGKLKMPKEPRMLYMLSGNGHDAASSKVVVAHLCEPNC